MKFYVSFLTLILSLGLQGVVSAEEAKISPKEALQRLVDGNKRFVQDKTLCPERNQERRLATVLKQKPFAIMLGCSDSRVAPELAFDLGIGDVFVVRVAGNVVDQVGLDSVKYSATQNGSSIVVVLGHENCGAVTAVLENKAQSVESIARLIRPAIAKAKKGSKQLEEAIEDNILNSVAMIKKSPVIRELMKEGKIDVVGAYYSLQTGEVRFLKTID